MIMVQFDNWADGINTSLASRQDSASNVPRVVIIRAIRSSVRRFLIDSNVWVHSIMLPKKDSDSYYAPLPSDTFICKVWDSSDRHCESLDTLTYSHPNILNTKGLFNKGVTDIEVSLSITQDSLECPIFIYDRYYEGVLSGALSILQSMPGKAWSEPNMVEYHEIVFKQHVNRAKSDSANKLYKKKPKDSIPPSFI